MKTKTLKILYNIIKYLTIVLFVLTIYLGYERFDKLASLKGTYGLMNTTPEALWDFTSIDVDNQENIYIGCHSRVVIFNKTGEKIGKINITVDDEDFALKIENEQLIIISNESFYNQGYSDTETYEFRYNLTKDFFETKEEHIYKDEENVYQENFEKYKEQNNFPSDVVSKNGKTYEYFGYGKVKVSDNNTERVINLEKRWFPLPTRFAFYPAIVCLLIAIGLKIVLKKKLARKAK